MVGMLPVEVKKFLRGLSAFASITQICKKYELSSEVGRKLLSLAEDVTEKKLPLADLPKAIRPLVMDNESLGKQIAVDLAGFRLLPIADYVGNVEASIRSWGGNVDLFSSVPCVQVESIKPEYLVQQVLKEMDIFLQDEHLQRRLEFVLAGCFMGEKTQEETKAVLQRPIKIGGLALEEKIAEGLVAFIQEKKKLPQPHPPSVLPDFSVKEVEVIDFLSEDKKEVEEAQKKVDILQKQRTPLCNPQQAIERVLQQTGNIKGLTSLLAQEERKKRFAQIVESRMREVRNGLLTKQQLERSENEGGLGFSGPFLVQVMELIEQVFDQYQKEEQQVCFAEKLKQQKNKQEKESIKKELERQEISSFAKRYVSLTGKAPQEMIQPISHARVSVAQTKQEGLQAYEQKIDRQKVKEILETTKKVNRQPAEISQTISPNNLSLEKPRMQDIRPMHHLVGPVQELGEMTLVHFRRLASDPHLAAGKIKDKIDLLEEEGYEQKIKGIQAWKHSPLFQLYADVSRKIFLSGKTREEVLDTTEDIQGNHLSEQEFQQLVLLNANLRF